jgi:hypothetical protein
MREGKRVGPETAAPFLAEMGEVQNYASHKKLIAFTGIDPSLHESGNYIAMNTPLRTSLQLLWWLSALTFNFLFRIFGIF